MTEAETHQSIPERIKEMYPTYMMMIRYFVSEGLVAVDNPSEGQRQWARLTARGDKEFEGVLAGVARATESAFRQRMLEGMPMVVDVECMAMEEDTPVTDLTSIERFHFLRLFAQDFSQMKDLDSPLPGINAVLCVEVSEANV